MNILNVMLCYNSIDIIPYSIEYYKKENIDLFVLDNYSNDGSWEYLKDNKIPCKRVDTKGAFDLRVLLRAKNRIIKKQKPDWVINAGCDSFVITPEPLKKTIEDFSNLEFDIIRMPFVRLWNTEEERKHKDPRKIFFRHSVVINSFRVIHKFKDFRRYEGDKPIIIKKKIKEKGIKFGCVLDYGNTRDKEKREDEYKRRQLAWERGLKRDWGNHYRLASRKGWIWNAKDFKDIRKSIYWKAISKRFELYGRD